MQLKNGVTRKTQQGANKPMHAHPHPHAQSCKSAHMCTIWNSGALRSVLILGCEGDENIT
eukprot:1120976-Pelagomonas_calceolata.AAC.3